MKALFYSFLLFFSGQIALAQNPVKPGRDFSKPTHGIQPGPASINGSVQGSSKKSGSISYHGTTIKSDSAVLSGVLPNGLHYYIRRNTEPNTRAELRLVVKAGSVLEDNDQLGAAHFVEHLQFNGTAHFKKNELVNFLERAGLQFGADLNAYTGFDETVYQLTVPTDSSTLKGSNETIFNTAFQVLADWAGSANMESAAIDKERGIITEEWRLGRGASARMRDRYFKEILKGSRYASRIPIGSKESINSMPYDAIRRFYRDWYRPDLEAIIAVGDFNAADVEKKIKSLFAHLQKPLNPRLRTDYSIPDNAEPLIAIETDPEQVYNIVQVYYKQAKAALLTHSDLHQQLVRTLFSTMLQSRLSERAREPEPPFLFGAAGYSHLLGKSDIYQSFAVARDGASILPAMENLVNENLRVRLHGFTQGELDRAKEMQLASIDKLYAEREKSISKTYIQPILDLFLHNEVNPSISFSRDFDHSELKGIGLSEVNQLVAHLSKPQNRIAIIIAPEKEKKSLPSSIQVRNMLDKKPGNLLKAYDDNFSNLPLLMKPPAPGSILKTDHVKGTSITEIKLSNGMRILVRPGNSTNDQVLFSGFSKGGASSYSSHDFRNAEFSAEVCSDAGLGTFSAIQLQKKLAGKNVVVRPYVDEYQHGISGSSGLKDLETAFQLIHLWFTATRNDSSTFKTFVSRQSGFMENRLADPGYLFSDTINAVLSNHNPRKRFPTPADIKNLNFSRAYQLFKTLYSDPGSFTFIFTGNADPEAIGRLSKTYLAGLPNLGKHTEIADDLKDYPAGPLNIKINNGKEQRSQVRIYFTGKTSYDSIINIRLSLLINALEIRFRQLLREDKGAVYGVGVDGSVSKIPRERFRIGISFACKPSLAEALTKTVLDEIASIKVKGIDSLIMAKVKAEHKMSFETFTRENSFWLQSISEALFFDEDLKNIDKRDHIFQQVSQNDTKALANRFFKDEGEIIFTLDPEISMKKPN